MPLKGKVEVFTPRTVKGWVAAYGSPQDRLHLQLVLDDKVLASCNAATMRTDLKEAGVGDGQYAFQIVLPEALPAEAAARVKLHVAGSDLFLDLPRIRRPQAPPATDGEGAASPVFITGSPRSGTSALAQAMVHAGYDGFEEGNLLGLSQMIEERADWYFEANDTASTATLLGNVNPEKLKAQLFDVFKTTIEALNPVHPWFDKTGNPETIRHLPRIMAAWPGCRVIFARRRGIENVMSRLVKFPERDFAYHCQDWAANMRAWRETRDTLDQSRIAEVDQQEMVSRPEAVTERLTRLLRLTPDMADNMRHVFSHDRPQETFAGSARRTLALSQTGWNAGQIETFRTLCGAEMEAYGYAMEAAPAL